MSGSSKLGSLLGEGKQSGKDIPGKWEEIMTNLDTCVKLIRGQRGCEDTVITVCIMNKTNIDTYSFPRDGWEHGIAGLILKSCEEDPKNEANVPSETGNDALPRRRNGETSERNGESHQTGERSFDVKRTIDLRKLRTFTARNLKRFLTAVRDKLRLRTFSWPLEAQQLYQKMTREVVPSAPGRLNAKKDNLILILKLSAEVDPAWRSTIIDLLAGLFPEQKKGVKRTFVAANIDVTTNSSTENCKKQCPSVQANKRLKTLSSVSELLSVAAELPRDVLRTSKRKQDWVDLPVLLGNIDHFVSPDNSHWFRQVTEPDGNCLFSAVMVSAGSRDIAVERVFSVNGIRLYMKRKLEELANAGSICSSFRREWLVSCLHDIDACSLRRLCEPVMGALMERCQMREMELLLAPLRVMVRNWARMVGGNHWGGLLSVELSVLATLTGCAIEVLKEREDAGSQGRDYITMCDMKRGSRLSTFTRHGLHLPIKAHLPNPEEDFLCPQRNESTNTAWIGPYPVLRIAYNGNHYDACTSSMSYPIPDGNLVSCRSSPMSSWFDIEDTLTEPYAGLREEEEMELQTLQLMIQEWLETYRHSETLGSHIDSVMYRKDSQTLTVSQLSRMELPPAQLHSDVPPQVESGTQRRDLSPESYMLCDDIVSTYMDMLQDRADRIAERATAEGISPPPKTRYFHSSLFEYLRRGLRGPSSRKQAQDLSTFSQLVVPALLRRHWVLSVIFLEHGYIGVYDPLGCRREDVFAVVRAWANCKIPQQKQNAWQFIHIEESRKCVQKGVVDCGVYVCKAAEAIGLGIPFRMSQWDVPYVRRRMTIEFLHQEATPIAWPRK